MYNEQAFSNFYPTNKHYIKMMRILSINILMHQALKTGVVNAIVKVVIYELSLRWIAFQFAWIF